RLILIQGQHPAAVVRPGGSDPLRVLAAGAGPVHLAAGEGEVTEARGGLTRLPIVHRAGRGGSPFRRRPVTGRHATTHRARVLSAAPAPANPAPPARATDARPPRPP